jgi:transposase
MYRTVKKDTILVTDFSKWMTSNFDVDSLNPLEEKCFSSIRESYEPAFEPLTGRCLVETSKRRTKADYCRFMQRVAEMYLEAERVVLVQDNLNTHNTMSFYEHLPPAEAFALAQAFEMHYTPKKGSWLNMAELELSALSRICLSRCIPSIEELDREVQTLVCERNKFGIKVEWQFTITQAREKLSRHYEKVKSKN